MDNFYSSGFEVHHIASSGKLRAVQVTDQLLLSCIQLFPGTTFFFEESIILTGTTRLHVFLFSDQKNIPFPLIFEALQHAASRDFMGTTIEGHFYYLVFN